MGLKKMDEVCVCVCPYTLFSLLFKPEMFSLWFLHGFFLEVPYKKTKSVQSGVQIKL